MKLKYQVGDLVIIGDSTYGSYLNGEILKIVDIDPKSSKYPYLIETNRGFSLVFAEHEIEGVVFTV